jgi:uncharacterized protein YbbC (DUF1343 family)
VGHVRLPVVHGMTLGEIARFHCADENLNGDMRVVRCGNWERNMTWPHYKSAWIAPSPNLPDYQSAAWYPGAVPAGILRCFVGRAALSTPFQIVGAPWIDNAAWKAAMDVYTYLLPDVRWEACEFVPQRATHQGKVCLGLHLSGAQEPQNIVALGMALLASLHQSHGAQFGLEAGAKSLPLLGSRKVLALVQEGDLESAISLCNSDASRFRTKRNRSLLY